MRFKTDESIHPEVAMLLRSHGHDAVTVWGEGMKGGPDWRIAERCQSEGRCLITLDLDFADIRAYPPENYSGLIVCRLAAQSRPHVLTAMGRVASMFETLPLHGHLWIVEEHEIRVRGPEA